LPNSVIQHSMNQPSAIDFLYEAEKNCVLRQNTCLDCGGSLEELLNELFDTRYGIDGTYDIRRCVECGLEQIYPLPGPKELRYLYEHHYNFGGEKELSIPGCAGISWIPFCTDCGYGRMAMFPSIAAKEEGACLISAATKGVVSRYLLEMVLRLQAWS